MKAMFMDRKMTSNLENELKKLTEFFLSVVQYRRERVREKDIFKLLLKNTTFYDV